ATRSTNRRSSGVGLGPANSLRSSSSLRVRASCAARFSPVAAQMRDCSACQARSPPSRSTLAGSFSSSHTTGRVFSSPLRARRTTFSRSFGSVGTVAAIAVPTPLPPFPARVRVDPGGPQRGRGQRLGQIDQGRTAGVGGAEAGLLRPPGGRLRLPPLALEGVHLGRQRGHRAGPDVLPNYAAVD